MRRTKPSLQTAIQDSEPPSMEADTSYVTVLVLGGQFAIFLAIGLLWYRRRRYARRTFTKPGFGFGHLGFHAREPSQRAFKLLWNHRPSFVLKVADWKHVGFEVTRDVCCVVGIDPYGKLTYMGGAFRAGQTQTVQIIGRMPHREREYDGSFTITLSGDSGNLLHFWCPFYRFYQSVRLPAAGIARLCLFPYFVRLFPDEQRIQQFTMRSPGGEIDITGISNCLFSIRERFPGRQKVARTTVYAAGEVTSCSKRINEATGKPYYVIAIDTGTSVLELVVRRNAFLRLPRAGEYVVSTGELTGYFEACTSVEMAW